MSYVFQSINEATRAVEDRYKRKGKAVFLCVTYYGWKHTPEFILKKKKEVANPDSVYVIGIYNKGKWIKGESRKQLIQNHTHKNHYQHLFRHENGQTVWN